MCGRILARHAQYQTEHLVTFSHHSVEAVWKYFINRPSVTMEGTDENHELDLHLSVSDGIPRWYWKGLNFIEQRTEECSVVYSAV
jgi:hypothetical protein